MRWLTIAVATLALAVAAAGCGGSDEESSGTATDTTVVTETTTDESTTEESTTDETTTDGSTNFSGIVGSEDCIQLIAAVAAIGQAFAVPGSGGDTSQFFEGFDPPSEIAADIQTLADWYTAYAEALQDIGFEAGQTPTAEQLQQYQAALAGLDQTGVSEASERIGTWANENCQG